MIPNPYQDDALASGPTTVTVRGIGVVTARPDGVRVTFGVRHHAGTAEEALAETAHKAEALDRLFRDSGIEPERWVTTGLSLHEWTEWEQESKTEVRRGYVGSNHVTVTVGDLGSL